MTYLLPVFHVCFFSTYYWILFVCGCFEITKIKCRACCCCNYYMTSYSHKLTSKLIFQADFSRVDAGEEINFAYPVPTMSIDWETRLYGQFSSIGSCFLVFQNSYDNSRRPPMLWLRWCSHWLASDLNQHRYKCYSFVDIFYDFPIVSVIESATISFPTIPRDKINSSAIFKE